MSAVRTPVHLWPCGEWTGTGVGGESEFFLWWSKPKLWWQLSQQAWQLPGREAASAAGVCGHSWAARARSIFCRAAADLYRVTLFSPGTIKKACPLSHLTLVSPFPFLF